MEYFLNYSSNPLCFIIISQLSCFNVWSSNLYLYLSNSGTIVFKSSSIPFNSQKHIEKNIPTKIKFKLF